MITIPECFHCIHYNNGKCPAYPEGIPYKILADNKDYINEIDVDKQIDFERPFLETQALINETGELMYEKNPQTGTIKVYEKGTNTKDRYVAAAMASYFIDMLEQDLISNSDDYDFEPLIN